MYLVGTVYHDPKGPERLTGLLRHYRPQSVSIDFVGKPRHIHPTDSEVEDGVRFFDDLNRKVRRSLSVDTDPTIRGLLIAYFCNEGYPFRTAMSLSRELRYKLFFVADPRASDVSYGKNCSGDRERFVEYVKRNRSQLELTPLPDLLAELQRAVDYVYDGNVRSDLSPRLAYSGEVGDEVTHHARLISELMPEMHIGELFHMVHPNGLMAKLVDLNPTLIKLKEADKLQVA